MQKTGWNDGGMEKKYYFCFQKQSFKLIIIIQI